MKPIKEYTNEELIKEISERNLDSCEKNSLRSLTDYEDEVERERRGAVESACRWCKKDDIPSEGVAIFINGELEWESILLNDVMEIEEFVNSRR